MVNVWWRWRFMDLRCWRTLNAIKRKVIVLHKHFHTCIQRPWMSHINKRWDREKSGCTWGRLPVDITMRDSWTTKLKLVRQRQCGKMEEENGTGEEHKGQTERKEEADVYDDWSWLLEKVEMMEHSQDKITMTFHWPLLRHYLLTLMSFRTCMVFFLKPKMSYLLEQPGCTFPYNEIEWGLMQLRSKKESHHTRFDVSSYVYMHINKTDWKTFV